MISFAFATAPKYPQVQPCNVAHRKNRDISMIDLRLSVAEKKQQQSTSSRAHTTAEKNLAKGTTKKNCVNV